jgi:hypothetical protein
MPATSLMYGTNDPLKDDMMRYALKVLKADAKIDIYSFEYGYHGLLNTDSNYPIAKAF